MVCAGSRAVTDGVDSYLIEDGKIVAQTIHYTLQQKEVDPADLYPIRGLDPGPERGPVWAPGVMISPT
jgi:hypothetical protein